MRIKVEFSLYWASTKYRGFWIWTKALSPLSGWKTCPQYQKHHYYSTMLWSFLFTTEQHKSQVIRYLSNPDNHHAMCGRCVIYSVYLSLTVSDDENILKVRIRRIEIYCKAKGTFFKVVFLIINWTSQAPLCNNLRKY